MRRTWLGVLVPAALALTLGCQGNTVGPDGRAVVRIDLSGLTRSTLAGRQVGGLTPAAVVQLTVVTGSEVRGPTSIVLDRGQLEAELEVKLPDGPANFVADVISNTGAPLYRGTEEAEIRGAGTRVDIIVRPIAPILAVRPDEIDLGVGERTFTVKNAGVAVLDWSVAAVTPQTLPECDGDCLFFIEDSGQLGPGLEQVVTVLSAPTTATFSVRLTSQTGFVDLAVTGTTAQQASLSIAGLRSAVTGRPINPLALLGDVIVQLDIDPDALAGADLDLLLNGLPFGCESVNTSVAPGLGDGVRASAGVGARARVECLFNTDRTTRACVGGQLSPLFSNGTHVLDASLSFSGGGGLTAQNPQTVNLVNRNFVVLRHLPGSATGDPGNSDGQGTPGANLRRYWGGPRDLDGDGVDDNDLRFAACPVAYDGTVVAGASLAGTTTSGGVSLDLGSGSGRPHSISPPPFIWSVDPGRNARLEDDPFTGTGQRIGSLLSLRDVTGADVTGRFQRAPLDGFWLDFKPPDDRAFSSSDTLQTSGGATAIVHTLKGTLTDTNVINGRIDVFESINPKCGDGDDVLLPVPGRIDRNQVPISNGTGGVTFSEDFRITRPTPFPGVSRWYCFETTGADTLLNKRSVTVFLAVLWL